MRIVAGLWRGTPLSAPRGISARPTTDRVKESMFNLMGWSWQGGTAIDLFAGSGALGLEALSRGARQAVFVDTNPASLAAVRENLRRCRAAEQAQVWKMDWRSAWRRIVDEGLDVGWVFVDPPYAKNWWEPVLRSIAASSVCILHGVVCEHPKTVTLPSAVGGLVVDKSRTYGDISVTIYRTNQEGSGA